MSLTVDRPTAPDARPPRRRHRRQQTTSFFAVLVAAISGAAALAGTLPIGEGDSGINAFDLLVLCSVVVLYRRADGGLPQRFSVAIAVVCLIIAIGVLLPVSGHLVVRSAGALLVLQALTVSARFATALVRGFLIGTVVHVGIALAGYGAAGGITVSEQSFNDLRSFRSGFDWFAGSLDAPPLSTSGLLRMQGLMGHPNEFAMLVVIAAMVSVRAVRDHRVQVVLVAVFSGAAIMALSRIAIAILLVGLIFGSGLGGKRVRRGLVLLGGATAVVLSISPSIRDRMFNVDDDENAQIRSAGPLDLLNDATVWPDSEVLTRHNSLAFMIDVAGVVFGLAWIVAIAYALATVIRPGILRREWGLAGATLLFFLTEDRIQTPSFLLATLVCLSIMLHAEHWPGGFDPSRRFTVAPSNSAYHLRRRTRAVDRQRARARSNHPAIPRPNSA